ncbi:putative serine esterase-domain-containing protein [Scheffersomyces xylosifermentans]|uniref:putative serine esterase-domain-containing protein n=1 Tax=Scheffersomyces xylosifermentans TaxID=1304137 RepID=UPI00315D1DF6
MSTGSPFLWYRDKDSLKIGEVNRYLIRYRRVDPSRHEIFFRLKNVEKTTIRAIHLLNGPFIVYCHVVPCNYDPKKRFVPEDMESNREVVFRNSIKPNQAFNVKLYLNGNSLLKKEDDEDIFQWEVDVVSQIVITRNTKINYDLMIGDDLSSMKRLNHSALQHTLTTLGTKTSTSIGLNSGPVEDDDGVIGESRNPQLQVFKRNTHDIWSNEPRYADKPVQLIWLTHGILSNLTADMLYLKDTLEDRVNNDNILVRGFNGNAGKTEKGVKKLGIAAGNALIDLIEKRKYNFDKISFIGHSLGGLVQLYTIKYILSVKGTSYFEQHGIEPINLISLASPFLGILSEMSFLIAWFLDLGTLGKTGRDLTLSKTIPSLLSLNADEDKSAFKPLLETLPDDPLQTFLGKFKHLTLYANAVNDGIVPLRTSALLYLDWEALGDVTELKKNKKAKLDHQHQEDSHSLATNTTRDTVGEIPGDDLSDSSESNKKGVGSVYKQLLSLNFNLANQETSDKPPIKHKLSRKEKRFLRITAKGTDNISDPVEDEPEDNELLPTVSPPSKSTTSGTSETQKLTIPPKASAFESAINALICPIPSTRYVTNPESRDYVIFHDRFYHFKNLPKDDPKSKREWLKLFIFNYNNDWKMTKQVNIAKKYHTNQLNWRKVLVNLPPDAHNNIVVRRRFANGYGWGVIEHICGKWTAHVGHIRKWGNTG